MIPSLQSMLGELVATSIFLHVSRTLVEGHTKANKTWKLREELVWASLVAETIQINMHYRAAHIRPAVPHGLWFLA